MSDEEAGDMEKNPQEPGQANGQEPFPNRKTKADHYFNVHLRKQREWYSTNASRAKRWNNSLAIIVLAAGALISVIQILHDHSCTPLVTAILGAIVVLAKGLERIGKYNENWMGYRKASESMNREYRLYINNAGDYQDTTGEKGAYRRFVEQVERILAEEQNQFWQSRSKGPEPAGAPQKLPEKGTGKEAEKDQSHGE